MNRLWVRLALGFLIVAWLAIGLLALVVRVTTEERFRNYLQQRDSALLDAVMIGDLEAYYAQYGTWEGAEALLPGNRGGGGNDGAGNQQGRGWGASRGSQVFIADPSGTVIVSTDPARAGEQLDDDTLAAATRLEVDGAQVGWLAQETPGTQALGEAEDRFLDDTTFSLGVAALGAALLSVTLGMVIAWQLTRPLRTLREAAHDLAAGELGRQVQTNGTAEISELGAAFNRMSRDLAAGQHMRQRMAANIAHELRTPVSVLRGHLEAMLDGVFPLDSQHLAVAYDRTIHLARLVDDLRLLTRAEAGQLSLNRVVIPADKLARQAVESFGPLALDSQVTLEHTISDGLPAVRVDVDRLQQVLGNLLTNALRHTPPGGTIALDVARVGGHVRFAVCNTGEGLTPEQAAQVFTPFWRAEDARERDNGGSGLGLAITQTLVELHGGQIRVDSAANTVTFTFELPVAE